MARAKGESLERSSVRSLPVPAAVHPGGKSYVLYGLYAQLLRACRGHITSNEAGELQAQADRGLGLHYEVHQKGVQKAYNRPYKGLSVHFRASKLYALYAGRYGTRTKSAFVRTLERSRRFAVEGKV